MHLYASTPSSSVLHEVLVAILEVFLDATFFPRNGRRCRLRRTSLVEAVFFARLLQCACPPPHLFYDISDGRFETAVNHVVELGASWMLLAPFRTVGMLGGGIQALFQLAIIISGNLSFLNYLTILPFIWCFDDR